MLMGLSVRLFGLSLVGDPAAPGARGRRDGRDPVRVGAADVRATGGGRSPGLVMALTPAAVLIFRFDNPDALLTLLLVGAARRPCSAPSRTAAGAG